MYYTHHFANHESLSRARSWLAHLGFGPERIEAHTDGIPRIALAVEPSEWSGVEMVIHAVERSDPRGWPGLWDVAAQTHVYPEADRVPASARLPRTRSTVIGWHPADSPSPAGPATAFPGLINPRWG